MVKAPPRKGRWPRVLTRLRSNEVLTALPFLVMVVLIIVAVVVSAASPSCLEPRTSPLPAEDPTLVEPASP